MNYPLSPLAEEKYQLIKVIEDLCDKYQRASFNFYQAYYDSEYLQIKYRFLLQVSATKATDAPAFPSQR
jgi:hypothetical protein